MGFEVFTYGNPDADFRLVQMVDDHDMEGIEQEVAHIRELSEGIDFCLKAVKVGSWNEDLSPWVAPAVFGDEGFGSGAASPSIWFPGFTEYMRENELRAGAVYMSLGDREERTRNPVMAQVGNRIREAEEILRDSGVDCVLEWNKGNHFKNPDLRTAKAFAWVMKRL